MIGRLRYYDMLYIKKIYTLSTLNNFWKMHLIPYNIIEEPHLFTSKVVLVKDMI